MFPLRLVSIKKSCKNENDRVTSPIRVPIHLKRIYLLLKPLYRQSTVWRIFCYFHNISCGET